MVSGGKQYFVYILTNRKYGALYVGFSSKLIIRTDKHKSHFYSNSFTAKYEIYHLVYYEIYGNVHMALQREKRLKKWNRQWKINLIEKTNPEWKDLAEELDPPPKAGDDKRKSGDDKRKSGDDKKKVRS